MPKDNHTSAYRAGFMQLVLCIITQQATTNYLDCIFEYELLIAEAWHMT